MITVFGTYEEAEKYFFDLNKLNNKTDITIINRAIKANPEGTFSHRPPRLNLSIDEQVSPAFFDLGQDLEYTCLIGLFKNEIKNKYVVEMGVHAEDDLIECRGKLERLVDSVQKGLKKAEVLTYGAKVTPFFYTVEENLGAEYIEHLGNKNSRRELAKEMKEVGMPYLARGLLLALFTNPLSRFMWGNVFLKGHLTDGLHRGLNPAEREQFTTSYQQRYGKVD